MATICRWMGFQDVLLVLIFQQVLDDSMIISSTTTTQCRLEASSKVIDSLSIMDVAYLPWIYEYQIKYLLCKSIKDFTGRGFSMQTGQKLQSCYNVNISPQSQRRDIVETVTRPRPLFTPFSQEHLKWIKLQKRNNSSVIINSSAFLIAAVFHSATNRTRVDIYYRFN